MPRVVRGATHASADLRASGPCHNSDRVDYFWEGFALCHAAKRAHASFPAMCFRDAVALSSFGTSTAAQQASSCGFVSCLYAALCDEPSLVKKILEEQRIPLPVVLSSICFFVGRPLSGVHKCLSAPISIEMLASQPKANLEFGRALLHGLCFALQGVPRRNEETLASCLCQLSLMDIQGSGHPSALKKCNELIVKALSCSRNPEVAAQCVSAAAGAFGITPFGGSPPDVNVSASFAELVENVFGSISAAVVEMCRSADKVEIVPHSIGVCALCLLQCGRTVESMDAVMRATSHDILLPNLVYDVIFDKMWKSSFGAVEEKICVSVMRLAQLRRQRILSTVDKFQLRHVQHPLIGHSEAVSAVLGSLAARGAFRDAVDVLSAVDPFQLTCNLLSDAPLEVLMKAVEDPSRKRGVDFVMKGPISVIVAALTVPPPCDQEVAVLASVNMMISMLRLWGRKVDDTDHRRNKKVPAWRRKLDVAPRTHKFEMLHSELPQRLIAEVIGDLMQYGFVTSALDLVGVMLEQDMLNLQSYSLRLLQCLCSASTRSSMSTESVALLRAAHRQRFLLFGETPEVHFECISVNTLLDHEGKRSAEHVVYPMLGSLRAQSFSSPVGTLCVGRQWKVIAQVEVGSR